MKLSDTARVVLSLASQHTERLAEAPNHLPAAARDAVIRSLLKNGLLAEIPCPREHLALAWRQDEDGVQIALQITETGLQAIGVEALRDDAEQPASLASHQSEPERDLPTAGHSESHTPVPPSAPSGSGEGPEPPVTPAVRQHGPMPRGHALRHAASAILTAWDAQGHEGLDEAVEALRAAVAKPPRIAREPGAPRKPRDGTKQQQVLDLLRRPEGASGPAIIEATGWAPHTVRGFLAGLTRKGFKIEVLDRVRQVGPGKEGAKGSYTIYRILEVGWATRPQAAARSADNDRLSTAYLGLRSAHPGPSAAAEGSGAPGTGRWPHPAEQRLWLVLARRAGGLPAHAGWRSRVEAVPCPCWVSIGPASVVHWPPATSS